MCEPSAPPGDADDKDVGMASLSTERERIERIRQTAETSDTQFTENDYLIVDNKYRLVQPYYFDFILTVKHKDSNRNIIDIFTSSFLSRTREYYIRALETGQLRIEGMPGAGFDTPLPPGTRMRHLVHRHEPPVTAKPIVIIGEKDGIVAVNKPASMLVHVAGQYRKNTVLGILSTQRPDLGILLPIHRLDKPVSGVLLCAKNGEAARKVGKEIADKGKVKKFYRARVLGRFSSDEEVVVNVPLAFDNEKNHAIPMPGVEVVKPEEKPSDSEQEHVQNVSNGSKRKRRRLKKGDKNKLSKEERIAAWNASVEAAITKPSLQPKFAETRFKLVSVAPDGLTSLVECRLMTGRPHQIRAHAAYIGHPIANDRQYGGKYDGPTSVREMAEDLGVDWNSGNSTGLVLQGGHVNENNNTRRDVLGVSLLVPPELRDAHCPHCPMYGPLNHPTDLRPLWLHAHRYECDEWRFEAPLPEWALDSFVPTIN